MNKLNFSAGAEYDFGTVTFSEKDIIEYARINDPLEFHTDVEKAKSHIFKNLVTSGQQAFHHFYVNHWIPLFGSSVLCGLSVTNWNFLKPIFANAPVHCTVRIIIIDKHHGRSSASIGWKFEFKDADGNDLQTLEMTVLHSLIAN